jgi:hypothetical protein
VLAAIVVIVGVGVAAAALTNQAAAPTRPLPTSAPTANAIVTAAPTDQPPSTLPSGPLRTGLGGPFPTRPPWCCPDAADPLTTRDPEGETGVGVDSVTAGSLVFWSGPVIYNDGSGPAIIDSVTPLHQSAGLRVVASSVWPAQGQVVAGFPDPDGKQLGRLRSAPAIGATVTPSVDGDWSHGFLVSLEVSAARNGLFHIDGLSVRYHLGEASYGSTLRSKLTFCVGAVLKSDGSCGSAKPN